MNHPALRRRNVVLDEDQIAADGEPLRNLDLIPCVLAIATGMRRGEILAALGWEDIDFEAGDDARSTISAAGKRAGCRIQGDEGATEGARDQSCTGFAVDLLRRHRSRASQAATTMWASLQGSKPRLRTVHGTPISPNELTGAFAAVLRDGGLPRVRFHDLRHGHATQLLRQGFTLRLSASASATATSPSRWTCTVTCCPTCRTRRLVGLTRRSAAAINSRSNLRSAAVRGTPSEGQ